MTKISNPQQTEGGRQELTIADDNAQELLYQILVELKKISLQLSIITDIDVSEEDMV